MFWAIIGALLVLYVVYVVGKAIYYRYFYDPIGKAYRIIDESEED